MKKINILHFLVVSATSATTVFNMFAASSFIQYTQTNTIFIDTKLLTWAYSLGGIIKTTLNVVLELSNRIF